MTGVILFGSGVAIRPSVNIEVPWLAGINPSAENLARIFFERVSPALPDGIELAAITIHETERNSATYTS